MKRLSEDERRNLGGYLKHLLGAAEKSQVDLAREMGTNTSKVSRLVKGQALKPGGYEKAFQTAFGLDLEVAHQRATQMFAQTMQVVGQGEQVMESAYKVVSFVNAKGGVGKTTMSINIASTWAIKHNLRVLLIDLDPQGSATNHLLAMGDGGQSLTDALIEAGKEHIIPFEVFETNVGIDLVPGGDAINELERISSGYPEFLLRELLDGLDLDYDVIVLDTPPNQGRPTMNALSASDAAFVVTDPEPMAIAGAFDLLSRERRIARHNRGFRFAGIVVNMVDNTVLSRDQLRVLKESEETKELLMPTHIPRRVGLRERFFEQSSEIVEEPTSDVSRRLKTLATEMLERM